MSAMEKAFDELRLLIGEVKDLRDYEQKDFVIDEAYEEVLP